MYGIKSLGVFCGSADGKNPRYVKDALKLGKLLAENNINIQDISQTIVDGFFTMMMITDTNEATKSFSVLSDELEELGKSIGVQIKLQREEIFEKMQRI